MPVTQQDSRRQRKAGEEMANALRLYGYFTLSSVFSHLSAEALTPKATVFGDGLYGELRGVEGRTGLPFWREGHA